MCPPLAVPTEVKSRLSCNSELEWGGGGGKCEVKELPLHKCALIQRHLPASAPPDKRPYPNLSGEMRKLNITPCFPWHGTYKGQDTPTVDAIRDFLKSNHAAPSQKMSFLGCWCDLSLWMETEHILKGLAPLLLLLFEHFSRRCSPGFVNYYSHTRLKSFLFGIEINRHSHGLLDNNHTACNHVVHK